MTTPEFVSHLRSLGINIRKDGGSLRCNGPKGILTAELEEAIRNRKSEILQFLNGAEDSAEVPIQIVSRDRDIPLSFAQERLWFLDQLDPNKAVYNEAFALRLEGLLNVDSLRKALDTIVARHEILRTTIVTVDETPRQVISENGSIKLKQIDLSNSSLPNRDEEVQRVLDEEASCPFKLSSDLMLRATLLRLAPADHVLLLVLHHIATDGWSTMVLFREIAALYEAFSTGKPCPLPELTVQYADFSVWQRKWVQEKVIRKELSYWRKRLAGTAPTLALPTDRPRPMIQTHRGARQKFVFGETLSKALTELSRREGVTLFMILLAGFKILLHRYSGQEDIVVGSPIMGRMQMELEPLIGSFANSLVLRTDLSGNPSAREVLARIKEAALGAYAHQELPFEKLVEELHPERDMSRNPLFQVMFSFIVADKQMIALPGLSLSPIDVGTGSARFDLFLSMSAIMDSVTGMVEYNSDLFEDATIGRMLGHFQSLLEDMAANPERRIGDLSIITEPEKRQLLIEWNEAQRDYPRDKCIHELFEEQAEQTPDAVAVVFKNQQVTYSELNARVNRLAHDLRNRGLSAGALVGIFMERSIEMVIALLGILKAGGAYVPLDPTYPSERLSFMLEDAALTVLVTQPELVGKLPARHARLLVLTADSNQFRGESTENPTPNTNATNLAYVIYTSGSTGKPKGVQIPHGALSNFLQSMRERPRMTERDVVFAVTTISFDIAGLELYLPLVVGGRVVIASREVSMDGARLSRCIADSQATMMQATPATWRMLIDAGWEGSKHLKILCGGEALPVELAQQLLERSASVWNMYGPTESTIWSTFYRVEGVDGAVPIGRPIANTKIYILDRYLKPVPIGVPGELHIGGDGLAHGYLNRPELTAEKFIADPFSEEPGGRIYRTGDLVRYLADGNIELLGRIDHQVKVRGFRIELGEIEAVLREHPALRDAVLLAREDVPGDKRLVAYVVGADSFPTTSELRSFLQKKLPDYMVPGVFVFLRALPLTPNGKVDRGALPAPDTARRELESTFVAPESTVEKTLVEIWRRVLGIEHVGIHDNFFDLGGHSLLMAKMHRRVQQEFSRDLSLVDMFQYPTIAALSGYLARESREPSSIQESAGATERLKAGKARLAQLHRLRERVLKPTV